MKPLRSLLLPAALSVVVWSVPACGDDPFYIQWQENRDTVVLYSLARTELSAPAGYDFLSRVRVQLHSPGATGSWDLALDTRDGELVFLPPRSFGIDSQAGLATFQGVTLDELTEAPVDSAAYTVDDPVPVDEGTVYVVRTRTGPGRFGQRCSFYGKLDPIEVSPEDQTVSFVFDVNPNCEDPNLIPDVTTSEDESTEGGDG